MRKASAICGLLLFGVSCNYRLQSIGVWQKITSRVALSPLNLASPGPHATSNTFLTALEIPPSTTAALAAQLRDRPSNEAVLVLRAAAEPQGELPFYTLSYLLWPRMVGEALCSADGGLTPATPVKEETPITWLLLYRRTPSAALQQAAQSIQPIGPHLTLIHLKEPGTWQSSCSQ
jgi:hypothetical protein